MAVVTQVTSNVVGTTRKVCGIISLPYSSDGYIIVIL